MNGIIFMETLRRNFRGMLIWGAAFASLGVVSVMVVTDSSTLAALGTVMKGLPSVLLSMMGGTDVEYLTTPIGFFGTQFFGFILLAFAAYAVIAGLNVTANDEDRGTLDVLLALPIKRWQVILEKVVAFSIIIIGMVGITYLATVVSILASPLFKDVNHGLLVGAFLNLIPATLFVLCVTALLGTLFRRGTAAGLATVLVAGSYFIDVLGRSADSVSTLRYISFYSFYDGLTVLKNGIIWGNVIGLLTVGVACVAVAIVMFQRRDVGV